MTRASAEAWAGPPRDGAPKEEEATVCVLDADFLVNQPMVRAWYGRSVGRAHPHPGGATILPVVRPAHHHPEPRKPGAPTAVIIGSLDGVHRGHAALIAAGRGAVGPEGRVVTLVFDPHPLTAINPAAAPSRLTTWSQRERWLRRAGADEVVRLQPSEARLRQPPVEFIAEVVGRYHPVAIVEGPDFRFGRGRAGDVRSLAVLGQEAGYTTILLSPVEATLSDHTLVRCSSTITRWLISQGRVTDAEAVLGRPYTLEGEVIRGDRRGRTLGFPTANIRTEQLLPGDGVYAAVARLPGGREAPAAVNIGPRPTFNGVERRIEAHLIGFDTSAQWSPLPDLPEYGWEVGLEMLAFLRDPCRFESPAALVAQLARDLARVAELAPRKSAPHHSNQPALA